MGLAGTTRTTVASTSRRGAWLRFSRGVGYARPAQPSRFFTSSCCGSPLAGGRRSKKLQRRFGRADVSRGLRFPTGSPERTQPAIGFRIGDPGCWYSPGYYGCTACHTPTDKCFGARRNGGWGRGWEASAFLPGTQPVLPDFLFPRFRCLWSSFEVHQRGPGSGPGG